MEEFTAIQLTEERGEVKVTAEIKSLLHVILSTKKILLDYFQKNLWKIIIGKQTRWYIYVIFHRKTVHSKDINVKVHSYIRYPVSTRRRFIVDLTSGDVETTLKRRHVLTGYISLVNNLGGQLYELRFDPIVLAFILGVISLMALISIVVVFTESWKHEQCVEKVENLNSNNLPSAVTVRDVKHDIISSQSASIYKLTAFQKTTGQQEKSSQPKKRVVRTTPESEYGVLIAKITNAIGEIKKQKNKKITKKVPTRKSTTVNASSTVPPTLAKKSNAVGEIKKQKNKKITQKIPTRKSTTVNTSPTVPPTVPPTIAKISNAIGAIKNKKNKKITQTVPTRKSTPVITSPTVQTNINFLSNLQISRPGTVLSASQCSKAKCTFNKLCKKILVTDNNLWFNFPAEIMDKMTSQKQFDVRVLHETFKTKPNLPDFNEENVDTLVKYQLIFQQFTQQLSKLLKLVSLPKNLDNDKIGKFGTQIKQLENKILYTKNALQMQCGKIPNARKQDIVYLQGYEDLNKDYNKEEILFILFNQINEIFVSLKNDFYKRQMCLGDIQCSS